MGEQSDLNLGMWPGVEVIVERRDRTVVRCIYYRLDARWEAVEVPDLLTLSGLRLRPLVAMDGPDIPPEVVDEHVEWWVVEVPGQPGWWHLIEMRGARIGGVYSGDDPWDLGRVGFQAAQEYLGEVEYDAAMAAGHAPAPHTQATPAPTTTYVFRFTPAAADRTYAEWFGSDAGAARPYIEAMLEDLVHGKFNAQHTESVEAAEVMRQRFPGLVTVEERPYDDAIPF